MGFYLTQGMTLSFLSYFLPIANDKALVYAFKDLINCVKAAGMKQNVLYDHFEFCLQYDIAKLEDITRLLTAFESEKENEIAAWLEIGIAKIQKAKKAK